MILPRSPYHDHYRHHTRRCWVFENTAVRHCSCGADDRRHRVTVDWLVALIRMLVMLGAGAQAELNRIRRGNALENAIAADDVVCQGCGESWLTHGRTCAASDGASGAARAAYRDAKGI